MKKSARYRVTGSAKTGFAVVTAQGAIEYDLILSRKEAEQIRDILNDGVGPEWEAVANEMKSREAFRDSSD